jgi:hypothetical protein
MTTWKLTPMPTRKSTIAISTTNFPGPPHALNAANKQKTIIQKHNCIRSIFDEIYFLFTSILFPLPLLWVVTLTAGE